MELEFKRVKKPCLRTVTNQVQRQEQSQEVRLTDGMPDIGKVLVSYGQPLIRSKEWRSDCMSVSGGVMAWVLYEPEDGSDVRWIETWIPFQMRWDFPESERDGSILVVPLLRSVDARSVSARKIVVRAELGVKGCGLIPDEIEYCQPCEIPEDICLQRKNYSAALPVEAGEKALSMEEDISLPASAEPLETIVCYSLRPELTETKIVSDKAVFRGSAVLHVLYLGQDNKLHAWDFDVPFSQYAQLDREFGQGSQLDLHVVVTDLELGVAADGRMTMKAGLAGQYTVHDITQVEIASDAYSVRRSVKPEILNFYLPSLLDKTEHTVPVERMVGAQADRIVDTVLYAEHPDASFEDGKVCLVCKGNICSLYYGQDEKLTPVYSGWQENLSIPASESVRCDVSVFINGTPQSAQGANEITQRGSVRVELLATGGEGLPMVSGIETGDAVQPDPNRPSLILCRAGNNSLWEIAKECGSTVELIQEANGISQEPCMDKMLLVPVV